MQVEGATSNRPTEQLSNQSREALAFIFFSDSFFFPACVLRYLFNGPLTTIMTSSAAHRRATYVGRFFVFFFIGLCGTSSRGAHSFFFSPVNETRFFFISQREKMTGLLLSRAESIRAQRKMKEIGPWLPL